MRGLALVDDWRPKWQDHANCLGVDPELFFPHKGDVTSVKEARAVCAGCTVRAECLAYALEHCIKFGVWGGLSERQRRRARVVANGGAA